MHRIINYALHRRYRGYYETWKYVAPVQKASGMHKSREADGGDVAVPAYPSRLRPPPNSGRPPCPAGPPDPAHRGCRTLSGLKFSVARAGGTCRSDSSSFARVMNGIVIEVLIGTPINELARRSSQDASLVPLAVTA